MLAALMTTRLPPSAPERGPVLAFDRDAAELRPVVRAVVAAVLREGPGHPDVEDCTHEAIRRALEGRARLRDGEPLRPWLVGIARHVALDALRARKRRRMEHSTSGPDSSGDVADLVDRIPDSEPDPAERAERANRDEKVRAAMAELPAGMRQALAKFHLEGKSYQQIAAELGVPLGTVATWVMRGRKTLAARMQEES